MENFIIRQDEMLLVALKNGDSGAFEVLYHRYKVMMLTKFRKSLQSDELAQDFLQELFLKVWKIRQAIDPSKSFKSYLYKISEHMIIDFYRVAARERKLQSDITAVYSEQYAHVEETLVKKEKRYHVNQIISQLPVKQQDVFKLFKLEGKSYKEIARILGISVSTINKHVFAANTFVKHRILSKREFFMSFFLTIFLPEWI